MRAAAGFTIVEFLIATALFVGLTAAMFTALQQSQDATAVQAETADLFQRARVATDNLMRDLMGATSVRPYRAGCAGPDPPGTFKRDTIAAIGAVTTTYWLKSDSTAGAYQLMTCTGRFSNDVPVVDHLVDLAFTYMGADGAPLDPTRFADGPWLPDAGDPSRWDADLEDVRAVVISLRVQSAIAALRGPAGPWFAHAGTATTAQKWVPDLAVRFAVAPRNLNGAQ